MCAASLSQELGLAELSTLFGAPEEEITRLCGAELGRVNLGYRMLCADERDALLLEILRKIESFDLPRAGEQRKGAWELGWNENLQDFIRSGYDLETLVPKYFKKHVPVRLLGDYALPEDPDFVLNCTRLFRTWLFRKYLSSFETIYEFGCGPATHLAWLAQNFPGRKLFGFDWASPSQEIIRRMAEHYGWDVHGGFFDFFAPTAELTLTPGSAVYTFGALEQIGSRHDKFIEFLLRNKPALCLNIECIHEFYRPDNLSDHLALNYHRRRNYLEGYLTRLQELEKRGQVEILKIHHQRFGNLYDDSHSLVIWRPL